MCEVNFKQLPLVCHVQDGYRPKVAKPNPAIGCLHQSLVGFFIGENSMSNHTPEPWAYSFPKINGQEFRGADCQISSGGFLIAQVSHGPIFHAGPFGSQARETNARRIVACVNACAGMETEHLENQSMLGETLLDRFNLLKIEAGKLTKQRDELLEALEAFSNYIHAEQCSTDGPVHYSDGQLTALAVMARKAIAKAKGGAA